MFEAPVLDPIVFAALHERVEGEGVPGDLDRLGDLLHSPDGAFRYELAGGETGQGRPELSLRLEGHLVLACQRCLGPLPFVLDVSTRLVLVQNEEALPGLEDEEQGVDVIVAPDRLSVVDLVEEEILLALPLVPVHSEGSCVSPVGEGVGRPSSPFGALAGLKSSAGKKD